MICEIREDYKEVVLRKATLSDVFAVIRIWLQKDREICFSNPVERGGRNDDKARYNS